MDNDLEFLFQEVYQLERNGEKEINFLSDWNSDDNDTEGFKQIISSVYNQSGKQYKKYAFSYEQFSLKDQIISSLKSSGVEITMENLTLTPNSTVSIFLTIKALKELKAKRVLLITPAYFSVQKALQENGFEIIYYHLCDSELFIIDPQKIKTIVSQQFIDVIILTDPVYCAGISHSNAIYHSLTAICLESDLYLIVDYSLGGLDWNRNQQMVVNADLLNIIMPTRYCFIDSMPKRLMLNGIKFSTIYGDQRIIDKIDLLAEAMYGSLTSPQISLIKNMYLPNNLSILEFQGLKNIENIRDNYRLAQTILKRSAYDIYPSNSGFFSVIYHKTKKLYDIDYKKFLLHLLMNDKLLFISTNLFSFFHENQFGLRINLSIEQEKLSSGLNKLIWSQYEPFK